MAQPIGAASTTPIPARVNNCNAYLEGHKLFGVADLQMPSLEFVTDTLKGAGIAGETEIVIQGHVKAMTATVKFHVPTARQFEMAAQIAQGVTFRAAVQEYDAGTGKPVIVPMAVEMKGVVKKLDLGKLEPAAAADASNEISVSYLKVSRAGVQLCEIDQLNGKCVIMGVDYLADVQNAI